MFLFHMTLHNHALEKVSLKNPRNISPFHLTIYYLPLVCHYNYWKKCKKASLSKISVVIVVAAVAVILNTSHLSQWRRVKLELRVSCLNKLYLRGVPAMLSVINLWLLELCWEMNSFTITTTGRGQGVWNMRTEWNLVDDKDAALSGFINCLTYVISIPFSWKVPRKFWMHLLSPQPSYILSQS
jgi:hypothetical protein